MNQIDLKGKRAVVTGGGKGIGRAIVERLAASGAKVAVWDIDIRPVIEYSAELNMPDAVVALDCDVSDPDAVFRAADATTQEIGGVDILVNNAGIAGANHTTWEYPVEEWRRVMSLNLDGVFYCCRAIVPVMLRGNDGRIVNVASIAGKEGNPNAPAYSAAKAGVIGLTKSLGKELAGSGIRVNCITPAAVRTAIFDQMTQEHIDYMLQKIPIGRLGAVAEIAALVAWLASEECSFSTGAVFDISGGRATY